MSTHVQYVGRVMLAMMLALLAGRAAAVSDGIYANGFDGFQLSAAPDITAQIQYSANRDSVTLTVPAVAGAKDFRVFKVDSGTSVQAYPDQTEDVYGATLYCAGYRQYNRCALDDIHSAADATGLQAGVDCNLTYASACNGTTNRSYRANLPQVARHIEIAGLAATTQLVVEAIDRQCPFAGVEISPALAGAHAANQAQDYTDFAVPQLPDSSTEEYLRPGEVPLWIHNDGDPDARVGGRNVQYLACSDAQARRALPLFDKLRTAERMRGVYGSVIVNGQGHRADARAVAQHTVELGLPANKDVPHVLARGVITVQPTGTASLPAGFTNPATSMFDDFADATDQPHFVAHGTDVPLGDANVQNANDVLLYQNSRWNFYTNGQNGDNNDFFITRGQLHSVFAESGQETFGYQFMSPRRVAHLPAANVSDRYLHVTFETNLNATNRRYAHFFMCGDNTAGGTLNADGSMRLAAFFPAFFQEQNQRSIHAAGWNCLQVITRDGAQGYGNILIDPQADWIKYIDASTGVTLTTNEYNALAPSEQAHYTVLPSDQWDAAQVESGIPILINRRMPPGFKFIDYVRHADDVALAQQLGYASVDDMPDRGWTYGNYFPAPPQVQFAHAEYYNSSNPTDETLTEFYARSLGWLRKMNGAGQFSPGTVLEDQQQVDGKSKVDIYVNRQRVVVLVNGDQRVCNNFGNEALEMADAALGFTQIEYHSSAERINIARFGSAQRHYRFNTPFVDQRVWDNVGFAEDSAAPAGFDATQCYTPQINPALDYAITPALKDYLQRYLAHLPAGADHDYLQAYIARVRVSN